MEGLAPSPERGRNHGLGERIGLKRDRPASDAGNGEQVSEPLQVSGLRAMSTRLDELGTASEERQDSRQSSDGSKGLRSSWEAGQEISWPVAPSCRYVEASDMAVKISLAIEDGRECVSPSAKQPVSGLHPARGGTASRRSCASFEGECSPGGIGIDDEMPPVPVQLLEALPKSR